MTAPPAIARVLVDTPLAHLDRLFDYAVPEELLASAVPGARVKVRFAGRLVDGFVVERVDGTRHEGRLAPLAKVVSPEPVLLPEVLALARAVAERWAGTVNDVVRLAVPPRHARAEAHVRIVEHESALPELDPDAWLAWPRGPGFVEHVAEGGSSRAVWSALPGHDPARAYAQAALAALQSGRGAVVCVPDVRDVARWHEVFVDVLGPDRHVVLTGAQKPPERYRNFLAVSRGQVQVVLGTRAAAYAPVRALGLVALWDEGDDLYVEPRAPYAHTREVLLTRAVLQSTAVLLGGYARTPEAQALVDSSWCAEIVAEPTTRRLSWPTVTVTDGSVDGGAPARLPREVFSAIRASDGAVLVQVPRRGYRSTLACQDCRTPARCAACEGPLAQAAAQAPLACRWCGTVAAQPWTCRHCGSHRLRAPTVGQLRTGEEYAQAFPEHEVVTSGGADVLDSVEPGRRIVLSTPGAEPVVPGGYHLVVLMDTWLALGREDLRVVEEAHRRWFNALALARERSSAVVVGDPAQLQALVRADPVGVAERELAGRAETHLPPVGRLAVVDGPADAVATLVGRTWTPHTEVLGPVPHREGDRLVLRAPRREGLALAAALHAVQAERTAAKLPPLRIQVDPPTL